MSKWLQPSWWSHSNAAWENIINVFLSFEQSNINCIEEYKNWTSISNGLTNYSYCVSLDDKKYFVQILNQEKLSRLPSQSFFPVNQVIGKIEKLNRWLVPCQHESEHIRIFDWVESNSSAAFSFNSRKMRNDLCQFLTLLHSDKSSLPVLNIRQHLKHYYQLACLKAPENENFFKVLYRRALFCSEQFDSCRTCHNDLSPGNIIVDDGLKVIDWEYACVSDPIFDLAGVCINFNLHRTLETQLIQKYSENQKADFNFEKFNKMKELYRIIFQLWVV